MRTGNRRKRVHDVVRAWNTQPDGRIQVPGNPYVKLRVSVDIPDVPADDIRRSVFQPVVRLAEGHDPRQGPLRAGPEPAQHFGRVGVKGREHECAVLGQKGGKAGKNVDDFVDVAEAVHVIKIDVQNGCGRRVERQETPLVFTRLRYHGPTRTSQTDGRLERMHVRTEMHGRILSGPKEDGCAHRRRCGFTVCSRYVDHRVVFPVDGAEEHGARTGRNAALARPPSFRIVFRDGGRVYHQIRFECVDAAGVVAGADGGAQSGQALCAGDRPRGLSRRHGIRGPASVRQGRPCWFRRCR